MGGWGKCPLCKEDKKFTEHHEKSIGEKILICQRCHGIIEEYLKLVEKYRCLIQGEEGPAE